MKRLLFNTFLALLVCNATAQTISVAPIEAEVGTTTYLIVKIDNVGENTTAMQFNLSLPNGITVDETNINQGEAATNHTMTIRTLANGDRMFIFYNMDKKLISNGTVFSLPVTMPKDAGVLNGKICTVRTASTDLVSHKCNDAAFTVTVKDATSIVDVNTTQTDNKTVYDMSGRRVTNLTKGSYIVDGKKVWFR
jgi:hypothetical protein